MLNNKGELKIADFGLSRFLKARTKPLTVRVVTLIYRAPELLLGQKDYTSKVDVWSFGCILAELYLGEPLFLGAQNRNHMTELIVSRLGSPDESEWPELKELPYYNELYPKKQYQPTLRNFFFKKKVNIDKHGMDLIERCLTLNPAKRLSAYEALNHKYFSEPPHACEVSEIPKIEKECHEYNIR